MTRKVMFVDIDLCYGCFTCEVACKQEHDLPVGLRRIGVQRIGPRRIDGKMQMLFYPVFCRHCIKPPCIEACPEKAIIQRADGIVLGLKDRCIGCLKCMEICPFGAIECSPDTGVIEKCDLCHERIDRGEVPACARHCPTGALQFGSPNELLKEKRARFITEVGMGPDSSAVRMKSEISYE